MAPQLRLDTHAMPLPLLPVFVLLGAGLTSVCSVSCSIEPWCSLDWRRRRSTLAWLYPVIVGRCHRRAHHRSAAGGGRRDPDPADGGEQRAAPLSWCRSPWCASVGTMASYPVGVPAGIFAAGARHRGRPGRRGGRRGHSDGDVTTRAAADGRGLRCRCDGGLFGHRLRAAGRCRPGGRADRRL